MTFAKYESIFRTKYPNGRTWMHNDVCRDEPRYKQKVAVEFQPGGRLYFYSGAYEDVLCKIGINCISKERFAEVEARLARLKKYHGTESLFGDIFDYSKEIEATEREIEQYRTEYIIA